MNSAAKRLIFYQTKITVRIILWYNSSNSDEVILQSVSLIVYRMTNRS